MGVSSWKRIENIGQIAFSVFFFYFFCIEGGKCFPFADLMYLFFFSTSLAELRLLITQFVYSLFPLFFLILDIREVVELVVDVAL